MEPTRLFFVLPILKDITELSKSLHDLGKAPGVLPFGFDDEIKKLEPLMAGVRDQLREAQLQAVATMAAAGATRETIAEISGLALSEVNGKIFYYETQRMPQGGYVGILALKIRECGLPLRPTNCLVAADIFTLGDLVQRTEVEVLKSPNLGVKMLQQVKDMLTGYGLKLKE